MKKFIFLFLFTGILYGCHVATNDEIIAETKKCTDAGFSAQLKINGMSGEIVGIQCIPK